MNASLPATRYDIVPGDPHAHLFQVSVTVDDPGGQALRFALPVWIPGSYLVREFARNIVTIAASAGGKPLAIRKIDKHTWETAPSDASVTVSYQVYAWDLSVRAAHLDATHGFFNGTSVFLRVIGRDAAPCVVHIRAPEGKRYADWRVATALREARGKAGAKRYGFGLYEAADYDELIDHPVELGPFTLVSFTACGTPHDVAITGRVPSLDTARLAADMQRICEAQIKLFEPKTARAPMDRYVFLVMAIGDGYGGLEHRASTALICPRADLPARSMTASTDGYRSFLGLVSHEYFHTWNVKRIKPAAFVPYDLDRENPTRLLWLFEGFTSYYDELTLVRTGLMSHEQYFKALAKTIDTVLAGPGRLTQSVAESSFDAWIKYYRQDENAPNAIVSYYAKGSLVGLALDLHIRIHTQGRRSLDDVMRALWREIGRDFYTSRAVGLAEDGFVPVAERVTGLSLAKWVRAWAYGTKDLPLDALLREVGVTYARTAADAAPTLGVKTKASARDCVIAHAMLGGAAHRAGLSAGDVLIAVDGLRVERDQLPKLLARYAPGDRVRVHAFRRDELFEVDAVLAPPVPATRLALDDRAKAATARLARAWLAGR